MLYYLLLLQFITVSWLPSIDYNDSGTQTPSNQLTYTLYSWQDNKSIEYNTGNNTTYSVDLNKYIKGEYVYFSVTAADPSQNESTYSDTVKVYVPLINVYIDLRSRAVIIYEVDVFSMKVEITLYNILGQKIVTIVSRYVDEGLHRIIYNMSDLPNGVYLFDINIEGQHTIKKIIHVK